MIYFGQSCSLTGENSEIGIDLMNGIMSAFEYVNQEGGIFDRKNISLIVKDDSYNPEKTVNNTKEFMEMEMNGEKKIFGLIGYLGTPTSIAVMNILENEEIPYIGAFTGCEELRKPFDYRKINLRSSYSDEMATMVNYLVTKKYVYRIAVFYRANSFGISGLNGIKKAINNYHLKIISVGNCSVNSSDSSQNVGIEEAVEEIAKGKPEAIIIVATVKAASSFINMVMSSSNKFDNLDTMLFMVGSYSVQDKLYKLATNHTKHIIMTQIVPYSRDITVSNNHFYRKYHESMQLIDQNAEESSASFEGFVVGMFVAKVLSLVYGQLTYESFYEALYSNSEFLLEQFVRLIYQIDDEDCIGNYNINCTGCNQGIHSVWLSKFDQDGNISFIEEPVEFSDSCFINEKHLSSPITFGQSCDLSSTNKEIGNDMKKGIEIAFFEYNQLYHHTRRLVRLISLDDKYTPSLCYSNTLELIEQQNVLGFIGYTGFSTIEEIIFDIINNRSEIFIGPYSGASYLSDNPENYNNVINLRSSICNEIYSIVSYFSNEIGLTEFSLFYQQGGDFVGSEVKNCLSRALAEINLEISAEAFIIPNFVELAVKRMLNNKTQIIVMATDTEYQTLSKFVKSVKEREQSIYFATLSFIGSERFAKELGNDYSNVIITQIVPLPNDTSNSYLIAHLHDRVEEYKEFRQFQELSISFALVEGYLAGKLATYVLSQIADDSSITKEIFLDSFYSLHSFRLKDLRLTYQEDECNVGIRKVWITELVSSPTINTNSSLVNKYEYDFDCDPQKNTINKPIFFGIVNNLDDSYVSNFVYGVTSVFADKNADGGINGRKLVLDVKNYNHDDDDDPVKFMNQINQFNDEYLFGIIGMPGNDKRILQMINEKGYPVFGTVKFVDEGESLKNVFPFTLSIYDEIIGLVKYLHEVKRLL